jgi:hypothetical protein
MQLHQTGQMHVQAGSRAPARQWLPRQRAAAGRHQPSGARGPANRLVARIAADRRQLIERDVSNVTSGGLQSLSYSSFEDDAGMSALLLRQDVCLEQEAARLQALQQQLAGCTSVAQKVCVFVCGGGGADERWRCVFGQPGIAGG